MLLFISCITSTEKMYAQNNAVFIRYSDTTDSLRSRRRGPVARAGPSLGADHVVLPQGTLGAEAVPGAARGGSEAAREGGAQYTQSQFIVGSTHCSRKRGLRVRQTLPQHD